MTEIALVRHGETAWNREKRIQGRTDIPLNETGRRQAAETGRMLASTGRRIDRVVASPLSRAMETGRIIADALGLPAPEAVPALVERDYGAGEGLSYLEIEHRYPGHDGVPGQEPRAEVAARVLPALRELAARFPDERIVAVSHGGAIRSVLTSADPDRAWGMIANGSVHGFRVTDGILTPFDALAPEDAAGAGAVADIDAQNALEAAEDAAAQS